MIFEEDNIIALFFNRTVENSINDQMMEYSYEFPYETLTEYITKVCSVPYANYIEYLQNSNRNSGTIESSDITQISSYEDCEINFCTKLSGVRRALTNEEIGVILQNDGVIRNQGANLKYGENHAKGAMQLGLAQCRYGYWYLSCLGKVFPRLDNELRNALIARTLLREKLYSKLICKLSKQDTSIDEIWGDIKLSPTTKIRRRSSVKQFLLQSTYQAYKEGYPIINRLDFTIDDRVNLLSLTPPNLLLL